MNYTNKYYVMRHGSFIEDGKDFVYKDTKKGNCWICQQPTIFIDLYYEVRCCSEECSIEMWNRYTRNINYAKNKNT